MRQENLHQNQRKKNCFLLILLLSVVGMTKTYAQSFTVGDLNYSVNNDGVSVTVTGHVDGTSATGSLTIPESVTYDGTEYFVTSIGNSAFYNCSGFTGSLTIGNSVTMIGNLAFCGCSGFTGSLTIGNSVTTIGNSAFSGCSGFTGSLTIGNSVATIGNYAFSYCSGFTEVNYNATNCADTNNYQYPFSNCGGTLAIGNNVERIPANIFTNSSFIGNVTIGNSVTTIGNNAFYNCNGLTSVSYTGNISQWCNISFGGHNSNPLYYAHNLYIDNELVTEVSFPDTIIEIKPYTFCQATCLTSLTIPNSVISIGNDAFYNCSGFTGSLTIGNSVTTIGQDAFYGCSGFTGDLTLPNSVALIGNSAFYNCSGFTGSLTLPNSVTTIGSSAFRGCSGFTGSLTIGNSVTTIGQDAFYGCSGFTGSLIIGNSVTTIGSGAFRSCSGFTGSLTLPNSVASIGSIAFYNCSGFTGSLTLPNSVTTIGSSAFSGCSGFTGSLTIGNSVASIGNSAFSGCSGFIEVQYNAINCADVSGTYSSPFSGCSGILVIGANVETIPAYMFRNGGFTCSLTIPNSVTTIGQYAFSGCSGFTGSLTIPNSVTTIGQYAFYCCSGFTGSLTLPNSVTSIGTNAFSNCWGFTGSLTIPNSVTTINSGAFSGCSGFTGSLTIPNSVTTIGMSAFYGCSGFTGSLTIGDSVTTIDNYAFYGCSGFTGNLTIGNSVTTIGQYAFFGCSGFTNSLTIPNSVTTIGQYAFSGCSGFTNSLTIPNSVTTIGQYAFSGCSGFTGSLVISNSVTSIGTNAFYNCWGFTGSLTIPNSVTTIGMSAFSCCSGFTGSLTIPNSVTTIGMSAFYGCSGFTGSLTIGDSVTTIDNYAFYGCSGFNSMNSLAETPPSVGSYAFYNVNHSIPITVPCGTMGAYQSASGWSEFTNYIEDCFIHITATANPTEGGIITGAGIFEDGDTCILVATPNQGYLFENWTKEGNIVSDSIIYSFTVTENATYVANFLWTGPSSSDYISDGLIMYLDGINNTRNGHSTTTDVWEDLMGNYDLTVNNYASYAWEDNHFIGLGDGGYLNTGHTWHYFNSLNDDITIEIVTYIDCDKTSPAYRGLAGWHEWSDGTNFQNDQGSSRMQTLGNMPVTEADDQIATVSYTRYNGSFLDGVWKTNTNSIPNGFNSSKIVVFGNSIPYSRGWNDSIYCIRMYNRTLSPEEIAYNHIIDAMRFGAGSSNWFWIAATTSPTNGGTVTGSGAYEEGDTCTLTATANTGYYFVNWTKDGEQVSSEDSYSFTVTENAEYVAHFECYDLGEFTYMSPTNNYPFTSLPITFSWDAVSGAIYYDLYVWDAEEQMPEEPFVSNLRYGNYNTSALQNYHTYNWFVKARNACYEISSSVKSFSLNITPSLNVNVNHIDFGEVAMNQSTSTTLSVTGIVLEDTLSVQITGDDAAMFSFTHASGWNDYNGGILIVTFNPTTPQYVYNASLVVSSGTFTETVTLTGAVSDLYVFSTHVAEEVYAMNTQIPIYGSVVDWNNAPVADAEVEIGVFVMGMKRTLQAITDTNGQFSAVFEPMPSESGYYTVNSGRVGNHSTAVHDDFNIPGIAVVTNDYILCAVTQDQPKTDSILIRNKSNLPLNNIQLSTLSAPEGCAFSFSPMSLGSLEEDYLVYTVTGSTLTQGNYYEEVRLKATSSEGAETVITVWYYCMEPRGVLDVLPKALATTMTKGKSKIVDVMLTNNGTAATGNITIDLPDVEWMTVVGNDTLSSIVVNDTAYFSLRFSPADIQLGQYSGIIAISSERGDAIALPYTITAVSDSTGSFVVDVTDDFTWNTNNRFGPHLANAEITLKGYYSLETVAYGYTDADGLFQVDDLPEGYYRLHVEAERHTQYDNIIFITAGETNNQDIYLQYQPITYSWTVEPTEIPDEYTYELNVVFETHVPVPVVVIEAPKKLPEFDDSYTFNYVITNHGLIAANDVELHVPISDEYLFTPLFDYVDTLQALTTIVIPCVVTHKDNRLETMKSDCAEWGYSWTDYTYKCLRNDGTWKVMTSSGYVYTILGYRPCEPPFGGSGGNGGIGFGGSLVFSGDPFNTNPIIEMLINDNHCNSCITIFTDALLTLVELVPIAGNAVSGVFAYDDLENGNIVDGVYGMTSIAVSNIPVIGQSLGALMTIISGARNVWEDIVGCYQFFSGINNNRDNGDLQLLPIELRDFLDFAPNYMEVFDRMFHGVELIYNDTAWLDSDINELSSFMSLVHERDSLYGYVDVDQSLISLKPSNINENQVYVFVERYNNTIDIINGQTINSNNYIPIDTLYNIIGEIIGIENESKELGYESGEDRMMHLMYNANNYLDMHNSESVCAKVTIQFTKKMTMTREAFEGTLAIHNGHDSNPMEAIDVNFVIKDALGNDCTNLFQINTTLLNNITGIDGTGSLDAGMDGMAKIQFIPTKFAAPTEPKLYYFGGTFSFIDPYTSDEIVYDLYPVEITVNPSPDLYVDYFMQRDILGDDALTTDVIEPTVPAELGVIIHNQGGGIAKNVILETTEPEIIDNEKGLAIDFAMYGASFNGSPRQLGLMEIPFGNIGSGQTAVGEWLFTSSLLGHFVSYEAHVIHNSSYGNPDLSLVSHLDIHELIHPIYAYGSLDDGINDFLVNDTPDAYDQPDSIYFSHGGRTAVGIVDSISFDHYVEPQDTIVILTINPSRIGWNYGVTEDPGRDNYNLVSCTRDVDGQVIPLNNVWQTFVTIPDGGNPVYENKLHIVDTLSNDIQDFTYTLVYSLKNNLLDVLEITGIPESYIDYPLESFTVRFNEAIIDSTFTYEDMTLKCQNGSNLMDSTVVITKVNDSIYDVNISGLTDETGYYVLNVSTLNVKDSKGYSGYKGKQATWVQVIENYTQTMTLAEGWNWWSSYLDLSNGGLEQLEAALSENGVCIKSQYNGFVMKSSGSWEGNLADLDYRQMYCIQMDETDVIAMNGVRIHPSDVALSIGPGWNWIGYPITSPLNIEAAFSNYEATANDIIKGKHSFAIYYEGYGWIPTTFVLTPGQGYMYKSLNTSAQTLTFAEGRSGFVPIIEDPTYWQTNVHAFADNLNIVAVVVKDDEEQRETGVELGAFIDGECRGSAKLYYVEPIDRYIAFLTVTGQDDEQIEFRLMDENKATSKSHDHITFHNNAIIGNLDHPFPIRFGAMNDLTEIQMNVSVYPNPVDRNAPFTMEIPEDETVTEVLVVDALGDIVSHETGKLTHSLYGLTNTGVYMVKATCKSGNVYISRVVVK